MKLFTSWFVFWEGAVIVYFFGLWWAAAWCCAWVIFAAGFQIRRASRP